ncbi:hypothetical protein D9M71_577460 [compost metagenome]
MGPAQRRGLHQLPLGARPRRQPQLQRRLPRHLPALVLAVDPDHRRLPADRLPHRALPRPAGRAAAQPAAVPGHGAVLDQPAGARLRLDPAAAQRRAGGIRPARPRPLRGRAGRPLHRPGGGDRPALHLPAVHGAADLHQPGEDGLAPGGSRLRPRRQPLEGAQADHHSAGHAGGGRRLHPGVHPLAGQLHHSRAARRR